MLAKYSIFPDRWTQLCCIVPVIRWGGGGARDSYFIVHTVKKVYGMHPLMVATYHYNTPAGIRNLAYLKTLLGLRSVDIYGFPKTVQK